MEEIPVKVAVRVRPLLSKEILHNHQVCVRLVPNAKQVIIGKDHVFTFDFVFGKNSTQEEVYAVCIKPLLVSLTEGYNAKCLHMDRLDLGRLTPLAVTTLVGYRMVFGFGGFLIGKECICAS